MTMELNPPKGTTLAPLLAHAEQLRDVVDAFNLTDSHSSRMSMAPLAVARLLVESGLEPMLQVTCRDRNRLALQSDLLAAAALGVRNLVCMIGDPPGAGDHPDAKPVFDLDVLGLLQASLPGLSIPAIVVEELDKAADPVQKGIALAGRIIRDLKGLCQGVHLITIGQERHIPQILQEAELGDRRSLL